MQRAGVGVVFVALVGVLGCQQGPRGASGSPTPETRLAAGSGSAGPSTSPQARRDPTPTGVSGPADAPQDAPQDAASGGPRPFEAGDTPTGRLAIDPGGTGGEPTRVVDSSPSTSGAPYWATEDKPRIDPAALVSPLAALSPNSAGEMAELMASINRKMSHDDGKGCLEDIERLRKIDGRLMATMGIMEAQCLMLVGQCQRGKRIVADYYKDQVNMTEARAVITAESIGSMRCRGGDMTERDQLLGALFELSDGAYMNERSAAFCRERIATVRKLAPKVKPQGPDDGQVSGGVQALFYTGAACFARAGACGEAFRAYDHDFPRGNMAQIQDAAQVRQIIEDSFRSSIERCKEAKLGGP